MNNKIITGKENVIHENCKEAYRIKYDISFLESTDCTRESLRLLYVAAIGDKIYPDGQLANLNDIMSDLYTLLDWAWLDYSEWRKRVTDDLCSPGICPSEPSFLNYAINSYYPNLQFSSWIKDRRERYQGQIHYLSQTEIYSGYLFFTDLFDRRSISEWKFMLNQWLTYALYPDNNIIDDEIAEPYEAYQDFEYLQKLLESGWISLQQEDLHYQDQCPWFNKDNYPVFSAMEFALNPYDELYGFFHYDSLAAQKKKINKWFAATLDIDAIWTGIPADLIDFYQKTGLMMECCWVIKELGPNYPKQWNSINTYFSTKRAAESTEKHPYKLPEIMRDKPENYLQTFFVDTNLNNCRHLLLECLRAALGNVACYPFSVNEIKQFKRELIMLIEAAYLIQKQRYPNRIYLTD